ncbi:LysR family transcriptional regulator [Kushneria sp. TE3]|uniref:LysR family transcriptional regulator n=1 Tax=Kushneria sp. TE3 TaxID=3449832 RepID=UPI003F6879BF
MDLSSRLLLLAEVVDAGSFTRAADLRHVDRSVISRQIRHLEKELEVRLFNRSTRVVHLTDAGREIYQRALRLRTALEDARHVAEAYQSEPRGVLRINAPTDFGRRYVAPAAGLFMRRFKDIRVELQLDNAYVDVIAGGYDLVIRISEPQDSSLIARPLARNHQVICASPEFIQRHGMPESVEALLLLPATTYSRDDLSVDYLHYYNEDNRIVRGALNPRFRTNDPEVMIRAMLVGLCYGVMSAFMLEDAFREGRLFPILPELQLAPSPDIHMVYPHREFMTLKTRRFIECLQEIVGDPPVWERNMPKIGMLQGYNPLT